MSFFDPEILDPVVHCFARCFVCRDLIPISRNEKDQLDLEGRKCPKCGAFLDDEDVAASFACTFLHTSAITSSKKLSGFDLGTIPYIAAVVLAWLVDLPIWFRALNNFIYLVPLILLGRWFYRNWYRFRFTDAEYKESLSDMKKSFGLWIAANLLCWMILFL